MDPAVPELCKHKSGDAVAEGGLGGGNGGGEGGGGAADAVGRRDMTHHMACDMALHMSRTPELCWRRGDSPAAFGGEANP